MIDFVKKFVINAAGCHLGCEISEKSWDKNIIGLGDVDDFIKKDEKTVIYALIREDEEKKIQFLSDMGDYRGKVVVFSKTKSLNPDNFMEAIQICSVCWPPTLALYQTLNGVFAPLLTTQQGLNNNIQRHLANLEADLRSTLLTSNEEDLQSAEFNSLTVVNSLTNELEYWDYTSHNASKRLKRSTAASFRDTLKPICKNFSILEALPLQEVEDFLECAHTVLDDLWHLQPPFPKDRTIHLMDLIANEINRCISNRVKQYDIWGDNYNTVAELLTQCASIGERWLSSCKQLTEIFWPNYTQNVWKDPPYEPDFLKQLVERLKEVLKIQTLLRQLTRLLTPQEQEALKTNEMFRPFKELEFGEFGQHSSDLWLKSHKQFESLLQPAEERVASKLKHQLANITSTRQLLHEFSRYSELIARPILKQTLQAERQQLLTTLYDYVKQLQTTTGQETAFNTKYETPQIVSEIIMIRQLEAQGGEIQKTSQKILNDLPGYENLKQTVDELLKDLKVQNNELFDSWVREISNLIKDDVLNLKESDPVVEFSKNKLMKVNYSPRLINLISEVRHFKALGYHVPSHIDQTSEHAKKFMKLARTLEQIANFHNTIGDRMIPSQRPMMLTSALELSRLVQEETVVSWGDIKSVEKYVDILKTAVENLSKENNLLASYYYQIANKIKSLEDTDLIKDYPKWKETTRQMRSIMSQVEDKNFKNMQSWKQEVDTHLNQILEKQYKKSTEVLHLYLPEIYTDIIYRNGTLQFSPDLNRLKEKYNQQLNIFLDIPLTFRGVSDTSEQFAEIINRSQENLAKVNKQTDELFNQLLGVLNHWQAWLQLDPLDVTKLTDWQQWELHFRASKTFGQEIAKLPSTEERVGCFIIGLSRLRSDLESHNRSYWDQLVVSLKDSIAEDVVKLQNFIDPSTALLTKQPVTLKEIGEAGAAHSNINKQVPEMEQTFKILSQKSQILSSWTREQVDSVNRLKGAWERLQSLLENHQHIIAKQMQTMKTTLDIESENLNKEMERFTAKLEQIKAKPGQILDQSIDELFKQFENIKEKREQWKVVMEKKDQVMDDYEKFNLEKVSFPLLEEIEMNLNKEENTWNIFNEFYLGLQELLNEEWIVIRKKIYKFDDFLASWNDKLKSLENSDLVTRILQEIQKYEGATLYLKYVKGEDFTDKHWMDVFNLLGLPPKPLDLVLLRDFLQVNDKLSQHSLELQSICKKAASEIIVRQALGELDQWEIQSKFVLSPHSDSRKTIIMLVKDFKEILNKVGDNQSLLQSVKNSSDYDSFSERAGIWENKLAALDQNLTHLAQIQRKWVYLEPIFGGGTLVQEKARFDKIDKDFKHVLSYIEKDPRVSSLTRYPNLTSLLNNLLEQLGRCQKSLDNFLLEKRNKFPRFLFLGDDDLLEVVGQSSKEQVIQSHLKKLFAGIHSIRLEGLHINAMCSLDGEVVPLVNQININQPVEEWLNHLVKEMQKTLKDLLVQCLGEGQSTDPLAYPSQVLCLADNITFTLKTEQAITNMTLPPLLTFYKAQMNHYSSLELTLTDEQNSSVNSGNTLELKLKALLLDTIHHIDVIEHLLDKNVTKTTEWTWQKQLRFYSNSLGEVTIKMANSRMEYAYEYLGNSAQLVRTPLIDRCFLTLTQGMHLGMGGNPYGPAGTGKTESVKALGRLLGRQVLVFNCDEGIDAKSMGRILSGLVKSGAWGCFDEFNRLDEATLSAVSMQIQPIQMALSNGDKTVLLEQQEIQVDRHCGIFVTLNPAGGGYGGRNKLPDNLKQLFRPVVMTHPDHEQIAKTLLHCEGFQNGELIGKKLVEVFQNSKELLSKQQHYDWGLRAIRTVLTGCGLALKQHRKNTNEAEGNRILTELSLVLKVLRMDTLSKLTFNDSLKFESLAKNIFQDVQLQNLGNEVLVKALEESYSELKLEKNQRQINKCLELYEQLKQRMGVAIIGPPSSGKSSIRNLLFHALQKMKKNIKQKVFNPKSVQKHDLLGQIDLHTRQWTEGILTLYSLEVTSQPPEIWSWIVCDGNIDPEWVESLNSVLDDNRLLSLPSGWRVQFGPNVNFIFETHDLSKASPATISRMGIVYLSEHDIDLPDYVNNYVKNQPEDFQLYLGSLINDYFIKAVNWVMSEGELVIHSSKIGVALTGLSQLQDVKSKNQFIVSIIQSLGSQLQVDFRELFAQLVYEWSGQVPPPFLLKSKYNNERDFIESYYTNPNITLDLVEQKIPLVMTGDISQTLEVLSKWLIARNEQNFLLVGPHGSAKSLIVDYLSKENEMELTTIHCSQNLTPSHIIKKMSQLCLSINTNKGKVYKPKKGRLILYFKNLHLLKPDKWGTNVIIEFLHQMITYNGFFDQNLELVGYENITIVGSLSNSQVLSERFCSIVHIYNISLPDPEDLLIITTAFITALLKECVLNWPKNKITKLASTIISIYDKVRYTFPSVHYKHYDFSPHDVIKLCSVISHYREIIHADIELIIETICNETFAHFGNKLVHKDDEIKLKNILNEIFKTQWGVSNLVNTIESNFYVPIVSSQRDIIPQISKLGREEWRKYVANGILQFGREGQTLDVLVNEELLQLAASVSKVVTYNESHLVLIGRAGIGRKSALKIVTALQSARLITLTNAVPNQLNLDLKMALQLAGIEGQEIYLLLEDQILRNKKILSLINILISAGEVPDLYNLAELESIVAGLKEEANRENFEGDLTEFFTKRITRKLHVIVCIDSENEEISKIFENCPALLHKCSIIWKTEWSEETIATTPAMLIAKANENNPNNKVEQCENLIKIFDIVKSKSCSSFRYITFIKLYIDIFIEKKFNIVSIITKLSAGVLKLTEAASLVTQLKQKAAEQQEKLAEKQSKANMALDMISNTMKNANSHRENMQTLKQQTETENQQLNVRKEQIELELAQVEPLIQQARSAVGNIKPEALSEIRSLRAPPDVIRDILEGVLRLMGIQDTSWNSMKIFLAKRGVKEEIRCFDAARITSDNRQAVERLMANKSDSFDPKAAKRASIAAAPLADWVAANVKYSHVVDKIRPLEMEQHKLKENLQSAEAQLDELSSGLSDVDATVAKLKMQLSAYTKEAAEIEIDLNAAKKTLSTAEELVLKLDDEFQRWQLQLTQLSKELEELPNNCSLAAAFITYLSDESEEDRKITIEKWLKGIGRSEFNFEEFLSTEREQLQWHSEGLSYDKLSVQNSIIILKTKITPLLIDPTSNVLKWFKNHNKNHPLDFSTQNTQKFNTNLELAVRFGKIFIVEDIDDEISSVLLPILRKEFVYQGERIMINLNGKLIDYNQNFTLILSSRNEHFQIGSELKSLVSIMNFTVTHSGLTEQLLSSAIRQENPQLEQRRKQLFRQKEEWQEKQFQLQNQLLEELANSSGDILQNSNLLASLNQTKASSIEINKALEESNHLQEKIQQEYEIYKEISKFGSGLYFSLNEFSKLNVLYVLSVSACVKLFLTSLATFQTIETGLEPQKRHMFATFYNYVSRGVFKNDRIILVMSLIRTLEEIPQIEWNIFIGNCIRTEGEKLPSWVPKNSISFLQNIRSLLPDFYENLQLDNENLWKNWMFSQTPQTFPIQKITNFQKIILTQALRPECLYSVMLSTITNICGLKTLDPPVFNMDQIYKESDHEQPILILTTSGTDPSKDIHQLPNSHIIEIAMGEGQENLAIEALNQTSKTGKWLILKNLHLVPSWLSQLSQNLQNLKPNENFRLWLITEENPNFHFVLAQNSLKIVYEVPQGLRNNLERTFTTFGASYFDKLGHNSSRIFFILACVQAILQERRTFIPQGWSKWYDFSDTDFSTCVKLVVDDLVTNSAQVPWKLIHGLCSDAVYRGRIENLQDGEILETYLREYLTDASLSHRWSPFRAKMSLPGSGKYQDYMTALKHLPLRDPPSFFGLPDNIHRAWDIQASNLVILKLKSLSLPHNIISKLDREIWQRGLSPLIGLWKKINQGLDFVRVVLVPEKNKKSIVETFIMEEFYECVDLVQKIHKNLAGLNKICKGLASTEEDDLYDLGNSLLNYKVPKSWSGLWDGPKDPTKYLQSIITKTVSLSKMKEKNVEEMMQNEVNLGTFINPVGILISFKQEYALSKQVSMDQLDMECTWSQPIHKGYIILSDLLMEGGILEGHTLKECSSDSDNINPAPNCYISWKERKSTLREDKILEVPLYYSSSRQKQLVSLQILCETRHMDKWVQAGLAFYLDY